MSFYPNMKATTAKPAAPAPPSLVHQQATQMYTKIMGGSLPVSDGFYPTMDQVEEEEVVEEDTTTISTEEVAEKLFGNSPPAEYQFEVPADLQDLGLQPDPVAAKEFSQLARGLGLSNRAANDLLALHLRATYGGSK